MRTQISPAALEAEQRIIGTCIETPSALERVECDYRDFGSVRWAHCLKAMTELYSNDQDIDALVLAEAVCDSSDNAVTLAELTQAHGLPSMLGEYSRIVRTEAARRRLSLGLGAIMTQIDKEPPEAILESLAVLARESEMGTVDGGLTVADLAKERFAEYAEIADARARGDGGATGFPSGIEKLDEVLGGIQPGIVTLIAARPSMGKSTLALNLTANLSRDKVGVHVFSLEEPRAAYADRVLSLASKVSTELLRNVDLTSGQFGQVRAGAERVFQRSGWVIDDRSGVRAEEIIRCVRLRAHANGTKVVVIDYINILKRLPGEDKRAMMDSAINAFADAAKRDGMAYIVLAQLNRGLEGRENPEPRLSDLKECGTLEERAKAVIMLHHPSEHDRNASTGTVHLIVRKNSQGRRGFAEVQWQPEFMYVGDKRRRA